MFKHDIDWNVTCSVNRGMEKWEFWLFLWSGWTWQLYWWTFFSVRPQESVQRSQLPRLTAWLLIKTVENEITPQIHHGRRWLSERSGAATHCMFTPGPLGLSALRVFLESRPDFFNGPRGFFSLLPPLLRSKPLCTPTLLQVFLMELTEAWGGKPPHRLHPYFPPTLPR